MNCFFQTVKPLKNLKSLSLLFKYVQNTVLSQIIETLFLLCNDEYTEYSPNNDENIKNFIRGPGVKWLLMHIDPPLRSEDIPNNIDYSFLSTVNLQRYFPKLERVHAPFLRTGEGYTIVPPWEPLKQEMWLEN